MKIGQVVNKVVGFSGDGRAKNLPFKFKLNEILIYSKGVEQYLLLVTKVVSDNEVKVTNIKNGDNLTILDCRIHGVQVKPFFIQLGDEFCITNLSSPNIRFTVEDFTHDRVQGYIVELSYYNNVQPERVYSKKLIAGIIDFIKF